MSQSLARRTFLKGAGLTVALPMLEAMRSQGRAADASSDGPVRAAFVFFPNGAIMPSWNPQGSGKDYKLSSTLAVIKELKSDFNVFTGLAQDNGRAKGDGPGDHARCASTFLTGAHPVKTSSSNIKVGVSVDQAAAANIGDRTRLASLELGIQRGRNAGSCDSGYSCAYSSNVSWKSATTPMAKEINPRAVFERLFGSAISSESAKRRNFYRKSVLDLVAADAAQLSKSLGKTDRRKMNEFFSSVRELEKRVVRADEERKSARPSIDLPQGVPSDMVEHIRLMYDLLAISFQTDTTRIASFMVGNAGSNHSYSNVDVNQGHHALSHHRNDKDKIAKLVKVDEFLMGEFGRFLRKLKSVQEGERTLLDNSMILYGSGISDANRHDHAHLPIVLAGKGGGTIETGRHVELKRETPLNNLFLSMLDRMDAKVEKLGDSSGRLTNL